MKNVHSFEVQHTGTPLVERAAPISTPVHQRQRKVGLALSTLLSSIGLAGCNSAQSIPETASYQLSAQNFGTSPERFTQHPIDPNRGFVVIGDNVIPVIRRSNGWEASEEYKRPRRSIMDITPDRFAPMTEFMAKNNLSREDFLQTSETYSRIEVIDQLASAETVLLRTLNEFIQNELHMESFDTVLSNYYRCLAALALSRKLHDIGEFSLEDLARLEESFDGFELSNVAQLEVEEAQAVDAAPEASGTEPTVEASQGTGN